MNYEKLSTEHDDIDALAATMELLVEAGSPAIAAVLAARDALATAVSDHLRGEDSFLYSKLLRSNDGGTASQARAFSDEFAELRSDWSRYLTEWPSESIEADWLIFREETVSILRRLQDRVRQETSLLYPLALQKGAIKLRAAAPK